MYKKRCYISYETNLLLSHFVVCSDARVIYSLLVGCGAERRNLISQKMRFIGHGGIPLCKKESS